MSPYKTIKDCAVEIICKEGHKLTNKEIAAQVRELMKSNTTEKSIAWYKNKINRGIIKVDKENCKWLLKGKDIFKDMIYESLDEINLENEAERFVYEYEKKRMGKEPKKVSNSPGFDFDSGDRHIEVKGKKKKGTNWLQLTANETEKLIKDPNYFLYLVEGDFEKSPKDINLFIIPQQDLLHMSQLKIHARLTQLSNKENRKRWLTTTI